MCPLMYEPCDTAIYTKGESLTEQEHKDSCDINKMVRNAARGLPVRGSGEPRYGYDDTTMDGVSMRIEKERLERELKALANENELSEKELAMVPASVRKKIQFKTKKEKPEQQKNDELNDDKNVQGSLDLKTDDSKKGSPPPPVAGANQASAR